MTSASTACALGDSAPRIRRTSSSASSARVSGAATRSAKSTVGPMLPVTVGCLLPAAIDQLIDEIRTAQRALAVVECKLRSIQSAPRQLEVGRVTVEHRCGAEDALPESRTLCSQEHPIGAPAERRRKLVRSSAGSSVRSRLSAAPRASGSRRIARTTACRSPRLPTPLSLNTRVMRARYCGLGLLATRCLDQAPADERCDVGMGGQRVQSLFESWCCALLCWQCEIAKDFLVP